MDNRKLRAAELFTREVVGRLRGVYAVYLFGSVAKGTAAPESDVDVLVVLASRPEDTYDVLAEAATRAYEETGEVVEFITMDLEEFLRLRTRSPFLYEVERWGKRLYLDGGQLVERARALARLADEYASSARRCAAEGMLRLALDAFYNAVELLLKALIMMSGHPLPRTHGGYIHVIGEIYVRAGRARENMVRDLMRALETRSKARYEPDYAPSADELELMERLYSELSELLASSLREA